MRMIWCVVRRMHFAETVRHIHGNQVMRFTHLMVSITVRQSVRREDEGSGQPHDSHDMRDQLLHLEKLRRGRDQGNLAGG